MISVIIPTYNRAQYLPHTIESVLHQDYRDFEIIVIDDSSTDNTEEVIRPYKDKIRYILQENQERGYARNNGIRNAKGEFVAFLDSDDLWLPNHLEECMRKLNDSAAGLVYSGSYLADTDGMIISKMPLRRSHGFALKQIVSTYSSGGCNASSCLIKKEIFQKCGYFNETRELSGSEDWEMWVRIASCTKFVSTGAYTVKIRSHNLQTSVNSEKMASSMKMALDLTFQNPSLLPKIARLKLQAYSSLYAIIAINYYACGNMPLARKILKKAFLTYPLALFINKNIIYTFLRTLFGARLTCYLRKKKLFITGKLYN